MPGALVGRAYSVPLDNASYVYTPRYSTYPVGTLHLNKGGEGRRSRCHRRVSGSRGS